METTRVVRMNVINGRLMRTDSIYVNGRDQRKDILDVNRLTERGGDFEDGLFKAA